ncbi:MAG: putative toxin-antitoxin system toxin component, PIN family [Acidimicrobiales bacterium]
MSTKLRAVLDTNVLVSAARTPGGVCGQLLDAAYAGHWTMVVSKQLLDELQEVLHRPWFSDWLAEGEAEEFVAAVRQIGEWADDPPPSNARFVRDPNDEFLVALARSPGVDALVSGDRDLLVLDDPEHPVWTPATFLVRISNPNLR